MLQSSCQTSIPVRHLNLLLFLDNSAFQDFYVRGPTYYNTRSIQTGNLFYYCAISTLRHIYVITSNLNMYANSVFHSEHNTIISLYLTIAYAPVFYFLAGIVVLKGQFDLESTECTEL